MNNNLFLVIDNFKKGNSNEYLVYEYLENFERDIQDNDNIIDDKYRYIQLFEYIIVCYTIKNNQRLQRLLKEIKLEKNNISNFADKIFIDCIRNIINIVLHSKNQKKLFALRKDIRNLRQRCIEEIANIEQQKYSSTTHKQLIALNYLNIANEYLVDTCLDLLRLNRNNITEVNLSSFAIQSITYAQWADDMLLYYFCVLYNTFLRYFL